MEAHTKSTAAALSSGGKLSGTEIAKRLTGLPNSVAEQVFRLVESQVATEAARQQRLDAKSTSLLTAVGLSLTVAFTFGSVLMKDGWSHWKSTNAHDLVLVLFAGALVAGILAAVYALRALFVTAYPGMNEDALFNESILKRACDDASNVDEAAGENETAKIAAAEATALATFRMSMTIQMWMMVQGIRANHAKKSQLVGRGQKALAWFLGFIGFLFVLIGYAAYFVPANAPT